MLYPTVIEPRLALSTQTSAWAYGYAVAVLLTLVCAWPEIGLPETRTDIILPELAVRAAETFPLWAFAEDAET